MFVIWGSSGKILHVSIMGKEECPCCRNDCDFILTVAFRYGHLFWLPLFLTKRQYYMTCSMCEKSIPIDNKEIDKLIQSPIPWVYKYGWSIPVGIVAIFYYVVLIINLVDILI